MYWLIGSLIMLSLPILIGFVQGFIEALRRPRPRLRLVVFDENG
jgi:hypothetical protein